MPTTLLKNDHVNLWYHPAERIIHHELHGFAPSAAFRELLSTGADCLEHNSARKWLSDDSDGAVLREEDAHWGDTVWAPRVIAAGFRYWAIVLPANAIASMQMKRFCSEYARRGVTVELFDNPTSAMDWLKQAGSDEQG